MIKKILVVVSVVLVALVIFGGGFLFAQSGVARAANLPVGFGPGMMGGRGGMGQIHEYVEQALADKLGITKAEVESDLASGKSMVQIAVDKGTQAADLSALLTGVHQTAFAKAVSDGVLTQAQADLMLKNMAANGFNFAEGPMKQNGGGYGRGPRDGRGMMGGKWNQGSSNNQ